MHKDEVSKKLCGCGGMMTIHMHTLIYSAKFKIAHVPVYTCGTCASYEPLPSIKQDLVAFIGELGKLGAKRRRFSFAEKNEWASLLKEILVSGRLMGEASELEEAIQKAVQGRIDLLLDVYRMAAELNDRHWMEETERRLSQLSLDMPFRTNYTEKRKIEG